MARCPIASNMQWADFVNAAGQNRPDISVRCCHIDSDQPSCSDVCHNSFKSPEERGDALLVW